MQYSHQGPRPNPILIPNPIPDANPNPDPDPDPNPQVCESHPTAANGGGAATVANPNGRTVDVIRVQGAQQATAVANPGQQPIAVVAVAVTVAQKRHDARDRPPQQMQFQVPAGCGPGSVLQMPGPNGTIRVTVPPGYEPGMAMTIEVPGTGGGGGGSGGGLLGYSPS